MQEADKSANRGRRGDESVWELSFQLVVRPHSVLEAQEIFRQLLLKSGTRKAPVGLGMIWARWLSL
jgi:hypothetical protein